MKIETHSDSEKQAQMLKLLQFGTVMVFVDSRNQDVLVPDHLKSDYQLRLNFDYAYEVDDFRVLPDRLEASLSFNRRNHFCVIPFNSIYLLVSHTIQHGVLFTQSVPIEMLEYFASETKKGEEIKTSAAAPALNVITNTKTVNRSKNVAVEIEAPRKKGHLRLVK